MPDRTIATEDLWLDADQTAVVPEGPKAAFLLARSGKPLPVEYVDQVTVSGKLKRPKVGATSKPKGKRPRATKEVKPGGDK